MVNCHFWTPSISGMGPIKQGLSVLPSFRLSWHFLGLVSLIFFKFWHGARNLYEVVHDKAKFPRKSILFCTNSMFGKFFIPEILAKMFSADQIAGYFNHPYLQNRSMKQPDFVHALTNSHKLKLDQNIFVWAVSKMVWPVCLQDSKIDCISKMNRWNELFFACWWKSRKTKSQFNDFWVGVVKNRCTHVVHETLKSTVSYK